MEKKNGAHPRGRSLKEYVVLASKGFCMGASDVIPGVSGGTMAFILGIYEELLNAIKSFDFQSARLLATFQVRTFFKRISWQFLLSLGLGILTAIFTLSKLLAWLLENQPVLIWSFFLGLILASVVTVSKRIDQWNLSLWVSLSCGLVGIYILVGLVPASTPNAPWFLFISGAIAICAMILPGISGSFILVLMGKYQYVLEAVNGKDFFVLGIVAAGACVGMVVFSRLLSWLLAKYHNLMVALLTGFMIGSLRKVWPWKVTLESLIDGHGKTVPTVQANILPPAWDSELMAGLSLMVTGFLIVLALEWLAGRQQ